MRIIEVLDKHSCIGLVGNRGTGKTSLILSIYKFLRANYPSLKLCAMGINPEIEPELEKLKITVLRSKMDLLDLQIKDSLIFIDEFALFFDTQTKSKQLDKLMRFFDRIEHLNNKIIIGTAREGYFNKFMCSRIHCFLVKEIEYDSLVNGTWLKERVKAVTSTSDYRLECPKDTFYTISTTDNTLKTSFKYNPEFDTKKKNVKFFVKQNMKKV